MCVTAEELELEEKVATDVERRVGKSVSVHAGVAELPDTLECLELVSNLVETDGARKVSLEERLRVREHRGGRFMIDLSLLEGPRDGVVLDVRACQVNLDTARVGEDIEDGLPLSRGLRTVRQPRMSTKSLSTRKRNSPPQIGLGLESHLELDLTPNLNLEGALPECSGKLNKVLGET